MDAPHTETASGAIATFNTDMVAPLKECIVKVDPVQAGTGNPSPENIRSISGWSAAKVVLAGQNLLPKTFPDNAIYATMGSTGVTSAANARTFSLPCKPNTTYYFSKVGTGNLSWLVAFSSVPAYRGLTDIDYKGNMTNRTGWTLNSGDRTYMLCTFSTTNEFLVNADTVSAEISLGSTKLPYTKRVDYEAVTIQLGSTIYGGVLDVTNGKLTETYGTWEYNRSRNWKYSSSWSKTNTACFYVSGQSAIYYPSYDYHSIVMCDRFIPYSRNELYNMDAEGVSLSNTPGETRSGDFTLRINKSRGVTDVESLKTWLETNPIFVVYVAKTPVAHQLSQSQIMSLRGTNNIFTDTGDVSVKYWTH